MDSLTISSIKHMNSKSIRELFYLLDSQTKKKDPCGIEVRMILGVALTLWSESNPNVPEFPIDRSE